MHRRLPALTLLAGALLVAACSDDAGPPPTGVEIAPDLSSIVATCDPAAIRHTLANLLTDGGAKAYAIPHFNAGQQADGQNQPALARQEYFRVISHVFDRYALGGTALPKRYDSVQDAVEWLVVALYDCAGEQWPSDAPDLRGIIDAIGNPAGGPTADIAVAVVDQNVEFDVLVPSRQFSFKGGGEYWDSPGVVIVNRIFDTDDFSDGVYNEYPPRYRITILPYTAQANFDDTGNNEDGPEDIVAPPANPADDTTALVSICPGTTHPDDHDDLFILRRLEAFLGGGVEALAFVTADSDVICDPALPTYIPSVTSTSVAARGMLRLRSAASALWGMLAPAPLYAVDGGIGGRVRLASDYVSAQTPIFVP